MIRAGDTLFIAEVHLSEQRPKPPDLWFGAIWNLIKYKENPTKLKCIIIAIINIKDVTERVVLKTTKNTTASMIAAKSGEPTECSSVLS